MFYSDTFRRAVQEAHMSWRMCGNPGRKNLPIIGYK